MLHVGAALVLRTAVRVSDTSDSPSLLPPGEAARVCSDRPMRSAPHCAPRCYLYLTVCISYVVRYQLRNSLIPPFLGPPCNPIMKVPLKWAEAAAEMPLSCD